MRTQPVPRTAMPFTFLEPMIAPTPAPPELPTLVIRQDMLTRFSPAGPMVATSNSGPQALAMAALAANVPLPHRSEASSMETLSSSILR